MNVCFDNQSEFNREEIIDCFQDANNTIQLILDDVGNRTDLNDLLQQVEVLLRCNEEILEILIQSGDSDPEFYGYEWPTVCGRVGRPALFVAEKLIRFLRDLRFTWKKIAELLGISESTLRRRRAGLDLEGFTSIIGKKHPVADN